jgi:hypothetical protein
VRWNFSPTTTPTPTVTPKSGRQIFANLPVVYSLKQIPYVSEGSIASSKLEALGNKSLFKLGKLTRV